MGMLLNLFLAWPLILGVYADDCSFNNLIDSSFLDGGSTTSCSGQTCVIQRGTNALLSSCSPLVVKSASNPTGSTFTPDPGNPNSGKILLKCSTSDILTASGFTGGSQVSGVTSVEQTKACCLKSEMALYSNSVTVFLSPHTPIDGRVYAAEISRCYNVDRVGRYRSVEEVCEGIHRLKPLSYDIDVECVGTPGQAGTWASFPGCIPLSGPGGEAVSTPVRGDRVGGGIIPPSPIQSVTSAEECSEKCRELETVGNNNRGNFGCVSYAWLNASSPNLPMTCWLKWMVPPIGPPLQASNKDLVWNGVFEGTIQCNDGSKLPCTKWCNGIADCPAADDELGCPEPCNTVHTSANNACGSTIIGTGRAPVQGGKYFQCSPGQCIPCANVCEKVSNYHNPKPDKQCPGASAGLDEASETCGGY